MIGGRIVMREKSWWSVQGCWGLECRCYGFNSWNVKECSCWCWKEGSDVVNNRLFGL
ncbi:hypothetical protein [Candidatus Hodgkinia cicadicola]|uniref:hypothetical protein n=1 Tax=Candidatus Hodgkinia cicadicola TaxID=573658 RepID=UPI0024151EB5